MENHTLKARKLINSALKIIYEGHLSSISTIEIDDEDPRIKLILKNRILIYIQFNNHDQYSYSIIFSEHRLDRCRYDNYDDRWNVSSKPHHFHPRMKKTAISSPMNGKPTHDIPLIFDLLKSEEIYKK